MGIGAGICKAEKERQVMGTGAPQRGARSLKNTKEEKVMLGDGKEKTMEWGNLLGEPGPIWLSWGLGGKF